MTSAVLTSNSAEDILQIDTKEYWDHTVTPKDLKPGEIVFITVNQNLRKIHNLARMAIVECFEKIPVSEKWTSNQLGNNQSYTCRIKLKGITTVSTDSVESLLKSVGKKQNTNGIMYLDLQKRYSK